MPRTRKKFRIVKTAPAAAATKRLRGAAKAAYERRERELEPQGCRAGGYRLLAASGDFSDLCCHHLYSDWRLITSFNGSTVFIVALGQHNDASFYRALSDELEINPVGQRREHKPGCCSADGWPTLGEVPAPKRRRETSSGALVGSR